MPKKPMPVEPPGKEGPSPPPPRAPHLPGGPSGPGSSEPQRNPLPQEGGFPVSVLVAKLITDIQTGIQAAFLQQVESTSREIEMLRALPEERLAEYLVPEEEAVAEFRRLFPPGERTETQSRISAGAPYRPAVPEKGQEEDPPIKRLTGYEIKPEDVREGRITPEGEKRIIEHLRMKIAKERLEAVKEVYRRGVPDYGETLDPDFYVVRISQNPASGQWIAQFGNLQGRVVLETEAIVEKPDSNAAKMQPMCTLGPKGELILFGEHDPFKKITIPLVSSKGDSSGVRPRFVSESRTLREAAWQVVKEVAKEPVSIEQVVPVSLGPVPLPDAITVLFNCGTEKKPDWCECRLVERGPVYSVWSCIGQESKKWYVFYVLRE